MKNFQQQQRCQQQQQQLRWMMGGKAWLDQRKKQKRMQQLMSPVHNTTNKTWSVVPSRGLVRDSSYSSRQRTTSRGCISRLFSAIGNLVSGIIGSLVLASITGSVAAVFLPGDLPFVVAILAGVVGLIYTLSYTRKAWEE